MWWEPRSQDEGRLSEVLPRLQGLFLENLERDLVFGVGSFFPSQFLPWWSESIARDYWKRMPLLLSIWRRFFLFLRPWKLPAFEHYHWWYRWYAKEGGRYPWPFDPGYAPRPMPLVLLNKAMTDTSMPPMIPHFSSDLPEKVRGQIGQWELPVDTVFLFVSRPEAVAAVSPSSVDAGRAIRCAITHQQGTVGVQLMNRSSDEVGTNAFLTVGHVFPKGGGSIVESVHTRWPRWIRLSGYRRIGHVAAWSSPVGSTYAAYDAAIVEVYNQASLWRLAHNGVAKMPRHHEEPLLGTVYGSVSGIVRKAGIVGTLNAYGSKKALWKNSWVLLPSGAISQGDSGAAFVLDLEKRIAGMVVGASREGSSRKFMAQYAQDMASLERDFIHPAGYTIA